MKTFQPLCLVFVPLLLLSFLLLAISGCGNGETKNPKEKGEAMAEEEDPKGPPLFQNVTARETGISLIYHNGEEHNHYAILESLGGGVAVLDFDKDGLMDLYFPGGGNFTGPDKKKIIGLPGGLFKNLGNWKFRDVSNEVGLDHGLVYSHGAAVGDYDRDGWPDLLVTGYGRLILYRNAPAGDGKRKFEDVTAKAGLQRKDHFWSTSAAFGDLDGDGFADLYVCQYVNWSFQNNPKCAGYRADVKQDVCPPRQFDSRPHALYRNTGKGTFEDVTSSSGIRCQREDKDYGKGLGVLIVDVNEDRKPDIYVANDTTDNFLYLNRSQPGKMSFVEEGLTMGVARDDRGIPNGSMGLDAADIDGSGFPSLWVTNYENELHGLYKLMGGNLQHQFLYNTQASGIAAIGQLYVGWGTGFLDLDRDGWEDLAIANGHVVRHPPRDNLAQKPVLLHNIGKNGNFKNITPLGGEYFRTPHRGRGLAVVDLDNDGRLDLVFANVNEPVGLVKNISPDNHHWLGIELRGKDHRDVTGARLELKVGNKKLTRFLKGGGSYASRRDPRIFFGLNTTEKVDHLTVYWPFGSQPAVEHWENLGIDRYHQILQGSGKSKK